MSIYTITKNSKPINLSLNKTYDVININNITGNLYINTVNSLITIGNLANQSLLTFDPTTQKIQLGSTIYDFTINTDKTVSYYIDTVNLNGTLGSTTNNNEHFVGTNNYSESLITSTNYSNVTSTNNIDTLKIMGFKVNAIDYHVNELTHTVSFTNDTGSITYLTDTISTNKQTIIANNAIGSISNGNDSDTVLWIKYQLISNECFKALNDGMTIYGNYGQESVEIVSGMHNETIDSNIEKIKLDNTYSSYNFSVSGQSLIVKDSSGVVVTYNTVNGGQYTLSFSDGSTHNLVNQTSSLYLDTLNLTHPTTFAPTTATSTIAYTVTQDNFSDSYITKSSIAFDIQKALLDIGKHISTLGTLDLAIHFENVANSKILAFFSGDGNDSVTTIPSNLQSYFNGANYATEFQLEQKTGLDYNGSIADMNITINLGQDQYLSTTGLATVGKYDLTTVLEHEILHGLGFDGFIGTTANLTDKTDFDTHVNATNPSAPIFNYAGSSIRLAPSSSGSGSAYYHVSNAADLMSESLDTNQIKHISAADLVILTGVGYTVTDHTMV